MQSTRTLRSFNVIVMCAVVVQVVVRHEWLFKLVGEERFRIGPAGPRGANCAVLVDPSEGFDFHYTLLVNGKPHRKFAEAQSRILKCWIYRAPAVAPVRICMGALHLYSAYTLHYSYCTSYKFFWLQVSIRASVHVVLQQVLYAFESKHSA